ncbi:MAG: 2-C-methyl-D-erythritol 2,4-cyclodiphosphate synthase [Spirochaetota bacterium]
MRIGHGYDLHRLKEGKGLHLGGFFMPCNYTTIAHSDGDVLCHAVIDSLLGALALGDIGTHFPPSEERWRGANSLEMLNVVYNEIVISQGFHLLNLDCTIVLEKIRLSLWNHEIRSHLLQGFQADDTVSVKLEQISVKAKTKEGVDAVGHGQAVEVYAVCLLQAQC